MESILGVCPFLFRVAPHLMRPIRFEDDMLDEQIREIAETVELPGDLIVERVGVIP